MIMQSSCLQLFSILNITKCQKIIFSNQTVLRTFFFLFRDKRMIGGQGKDVPPTLLSQADIFY